MATQRSTYGPVRGGLRQNRRTGEWHVRARINGKTVSQGTGTSDRVVAREFLDRLRRVGKPGAARAAMTWREAAELYEASLDSARAAGEIRPNTHRGRMVALRAAERVLVEVAGDDAPVKPMRDLNDRDLLARWRHANASKSPPHANACLLALRRLFRLAWQRGALAGPPVADHLDRKRGGSSRRQVPTDEEFKRVLQALADNRFNPRRHAARDLVLAMAYSGGRVSEVTQLRPDDVDLRRGTIHFRVETVKGARQERWVPIFDSTRAFWADLVSRAKRGRLLESTSCRASLREACRRAGVARMGHHSLRHLFATRALECTGGDVKAVATWLGHRDGGALLLKTYTHARQQALAAAAAKVQFGY